MQLYHMYFISLCNFSNFSLPMTVKFAMPEPSGDEARHVNCSRDESLKLNLTQNKT